MHSVICGIRGSFLWKSSRLDFCFAQGKVFHSFMMFHCYDVVMPWDPPASPRSVELRMKRGRLGFYLQRIDLLCPMKYVKICQNMSNMSNILKSSLGQSHRLKRLRRMRRRLPSWSSAWASPKRQGHFDSPVVHFASAEASPELHLSREHKLMSRKYQHTQIYHSSTNNFQNAKRERNWNLTTSTVWTHGHSIEVPNLWGRPQQSLRRRVGRDRACKENHRVAGWSTSAWNTTGTPLTHHKPIQTVLHSRCETLGHHCLPSLLGMEQTLLAAREKTRTSLEQITAHHSFLQKQRRRNTAMWQSLFFTSCQKASEGLWPSPQRLPGSKLCMKILET